MPEDPQGQRRPADLVGCAVEVAKSATGEIEASPAPSNNAKSGHAGTAVRDEELSRKERSAVAKKAVAGRWE
jgi:hypothetical protein